MITANQNPFLMLLCDQPEEAESMNKLTRFATYQKTFLGWKVAGFKPAVSTLCSLTYNSERVHSKIVLGAQNLQITPRLLHERQMSQVALRRCAD